MYDMPELYDERAEMYDDTPEKHLTTTGMYKAMLQLKQ